MRTISGDACSNRLVATGIVKRFNGVVALDGVDLTLESGRVTGLLGPNGSGKTTFVNCLSGVLSPTAGSMKLDGRPIDTLSRRNRARLGVVRTYQNLRLFLTLSVAENVGAGLFAAGLPRSRRARRQLLRLTLDEHGLGRHAHRVVGDLPYGLQKRTEIARALIAAPRFLLLDEPAAGLGTAEWRELALSLDAARSRLGCAMLLIDHNIAFMKELVDTLTVLADGRIVREGSPSEVLRDRDVAWIYLGESDAAH